MKRNHQIIRKLNNKGGVFLTSLFVLTILIGLMASVFVSSMSELNGSKRFRDATAALWTAEAGISRYIQDTTLLDDADQTISVGVNSVFISKDDSDSQRRIVTATGTSNGVSRQIEVEFPTLPPGLFDNTLSSGGDITLNGFIAGVTVNGKTRLSGEFDKNGFLTNANFEDKQEGVASNLTTLEYPDLNENDESDFDDFVSYNRRFVDSDDPDFTDEYSEDEVLHIQTNDTVDIWPSSDLAGKKVIFVEGSEAGNGNVNVWFDTTWAADQNVTIISTGSVNYVQPLQSPSANSQLNTISWEDYNEFAVLYSSHSGSTYTNKQANFGSLVSLSKTKGNLIANEGINLDLIFVWKQFDFESPVDDEGLVPPGFQGLISGGSGGYSTTPSSWAEI